MGDIIAMAREAGFESNSLGMTYTSGRLPELLERFAALVAAAERNKLASWMIAQGYATGHGETMEGLLEELEQEIGFDRAELCELWIKRINKAVLDEREACAKVADKWVEGPERNYSELIADEIRARGQA
jgi:hypothetical protein